MTEMTENERLITTLRLFTDLLTPIWFWKLDAQFNVIRSDCPNESLFRSLFLRDGRREAIEKHMQSSDAPVCFTVSSMLSWIMAFGREDGSVSAMYVMGPFFIGVNDPETYSEYLTPLKLSKEAEEMLRNGLSSLPVLSNSDAARNAVLLHYCVRKEKLTPADVVSYVSQPRHARQRRKVEIDQFEKSSGRWAMEQELLNGIRSGDPAAGEVLSGVSQKHMIRSFGSAQSAEAAKMNLHQLLTLISRAAVEGGLPQKTAFALCSDYREKLEKCVTAEQFNSISKEIIRDYATRVHNMKQYAACSSQIRLTCEYIETHPGDKLTLEELAQKAGYSPFHMSRKFRKEMNCSLVEYIKRSKLERAKYLLSHTEESVDDISAELGFNTRSYFTTVFRNEVGMTPTDYRRKNMII